MVKSVAQALEEKINPLAREVSNLPEDYPDEATKMALLSSLTSAPEGKKVTKIGFWEDADGNVKYMKFYDGEEELFVLTVSNAGEATEETWNIARS